MAEGVGFEPTELSLSGFQDRRLKPLGHPSAMIAELQAARDYSGSAAPFASGTEWTALGLRDRVAGDRVAHGRVAGGGVAGDHLADAAPG